MKNYTLTACFAVVCLSFFSRCDESTTVESQIDTLYIVNQDTVYLSTTVYDTLILTNSDTVYISETDTLYISEADTLFLHVNYFTPVADAAIFKEFDYYQDPAEDPIDTDTDTLAASGASETIRAGASVNNNFKTRSLIKFDFSDIPAGASVISASLDMNLARDGSGSTDIEILIHKLTEDWTEGATYDCCSADGGQCGSLSNIGDTPTCYDNTRVSSVTNEGGDVTWIYASYDETTPVFWSTEGGVFDSEVSASSYEEGSSATFFATEGIQSDIESWVSGATENYGWIIKTDEEEIERLVTEESASGLQYRYTSRESTHKPILKVMYLTQE